MAFALYSCDPDNPSEDAREIKPVVSANQTSFNVAEGEAASVTLTTTTPYRTTMEFKIELVGGTAGADDYTISPTLVGPTTLADGIGPDGAFLLEFPANTSTFTFDITPILDLLPEGTENLQFALTSSGNGRGLVAPGSEFINVSITNTISDDFYASISWDGTYLGVDGDEHDYCDFDFDLELYDDSFNLVESSYSSCPEELTLDQSNQDGQYSIVASFFSNAGVVPASGEINFPLMLTVSRPGAFVSVVDLSTIFKYTDGGVDEGNPDGYYIAATVDKVGSTYTVRDANDPTIVIGQGRIADLGKFLKGKSHKRKL